ncbi:B-type cyclin CLB2 NDAI_0A04660 [Naumovozyma dairenensis CBS 421]|uniref:Uncharacterized protein n=1 Tax=Naumovozyma dairenensis (strain ATCC 10597 / BCRC 20456 / CBS 421 / NBRC 0211 / NRRL Y-12639) TaxID=1071378 RepID=G0W484_NAUDC|nr:hypothetical protein NDAI_0A04660 [Naumovozyma dairenensis CBS 421]CCD22622.1 hypothetical protein NDAI_0A04660 [Naumovozyma dairenensis CBS 421]
MSNKSMIPSSRNDETIHNNENNIKENAIVGNVQRAVLNNVTNTMLAQDENSHNSALRSLKTSLTIAKKEGTRIPQINKDILSRSTLLNNISNNAQGKTETENSHSSVSDNKENQNPYLASKNNQLSSIQEEEREYNTQEIQSNLHSTQQPNANVEEQHNYLQANHENDISTDMTKKRPISTVVEQDLPKKYKVCTENGEEEYEWEDLDEEDSNDPFMVSEYVNDIFGYLHQLEISTLPAKENLKKHKNINQNRDILVNWLVKIHNKFGLLPETLYLAINIMDRFLCKELVQLDKLQLVGTSCLFIASKYEEVYSPSIKHFASETDGACTEDEIKEGEKFILKTLEFSLKYPNPMNFLRRISKADDYDIQSRTLAKFLLEISLVDFRFIGILPSLCAAAAMFLSRKMLGKGKWDGNLIHYSGGYTKSQLAPVCDMIMDYLVSPIVHDEFHRKYQSRRFMKASIISVQWALKVRKNGYDIMTLHE